MARKKENQDQEMNESIKAQMDLITNPDGTSELSEVYTTNNGVKYTRVNPGEYPVVTDDESVVFESFPQATIPPINLDDLPPPPKNGLTEGRMVHFVLGNWSHRPAVIVNAWKDQGYSHGEVNLTVFMDWQNDGHPLGIDWQTSVPFDDDQRRPGTWHWIEPA